MAQRKTSKMWLDRVAYDIDTAKAMLQTGRLIYPEPRGPRLPAGRQGFHPWVNWSSGTGCSPLVGVSREPRALPVGLHAIFMCQQSLEKCFKALLAYRNKEIIPIHNLRRLAEVAEVIHEIDEPTLVKLDFLSSYYTNARYKEDLEQLSRGITEPVARDFV